MQIASGIVTGVTLFGVINLTLVLSISRHPVKILTLLSCVLSYNYHFYHACVRLGGTPTLQRMGYGCSRVLIH